MSGPTTDMVGGIAQLLAAAGIAVYRPDGLVYTADETAITKKDLPPAPDRVIAITAYGAGDDQPVITYGQRFVQLRFRGAAGDPDDVDDLADAAFDALHGRENLTFGSVHVTQILRFSSVPLGMDEQSRRWQRADNYQLDVDWPSSATRPL